MGKIIGIDLGTTTLRCRHRGRFGQGHREFEGDRTTPSVVAFTATTVLVGARPSCQAVTNAKNTLYAVSGLIGRKFTEQVVQKDLDMVPYSIMAADNGDAWIDAGGKKMAPPEISRAR